MLWVQIIYFFMPCPVNSVVGRFPPRDSVELTPTEGNRFEIPVRILIINLYQVISEMWPFWNVGKEYH